MYCTIGCVGKHCQCYLTEVCQLSVNFVLVIS